MGHFAVGPGGLKSIVTGGIKTDRGEIDLSRQNKMGSSKNKKKTDISPLPLGT